MARTGQEREGERKRRWGRGRWRVRGREGVREREYSNHSELRSSHRSVDLPRGIGRERKKESTHAH